MRANSQDHEKFIAPKKKIFNKIHHHDEGRQTSEQRGENKSKAFSAPPRLYLITRLEHDSLGSVRPWWCALFCHLSASTDKLRCAVDAAPPPPSIDISAIKEAAAGRR